MAKCKLKELLFRVGCILCPFCDTCKVLTAPQWPLKHVQLVGSLVLKMKSTPNACRMYVRGNNKTVTDIHTYIYTYVQTQAECATRLFASC